MALSKDIEKGIEVKVVPILNSSASTLVPTKPESPTTTLDQAPFHPPDGGLTAWLQVVAGFLLSCVAWGYPAMFGVYQLYYTQTLGLPPTQVSWIGSTQTFLTYLLCTASGRLSDGGHALATCIAGTVLAVAGTFLTSLCRDYWHMFLAQGVLTGLGLGLLTTPPLTVISAYFDRRRTMALAMSTMGTSAGGALFPAVVQYLIPRVGFAWAVRCAALVALVLCANACLLLRPVPVVKGCGKGKGVGRGRVTDGLVDWAAFREAPYVLFTVASFLIFWALYFGFFYINTFAETTLHLPPTTAASMLILSTALGIPTRPLAGAVADLWLGASNTFVLAVLLLGAAHFVWAAVSSEAGMWAFVVLFGLANGCAQGIWAGALAGVVGPANRARLGTRFGMVCTLTAFATLAGPPTASALIQAASGQYVAAQVWAGVVICLGAGALAVGRGLQAGWRVWVKV